MNKRLSEQDAAFIALERSGTPMNIGILAVCDGARDLERIQTLATKRLHRLDASGRRLGRPDGRGRRYWIDGAAPDLSRITLPRANDEDVLAWFGAQLGTTFAEDQPLWRGWLLDTPSSDRFAIAMMAHHALVDGVGGITWWNELFDRGQSPHARRRASEEDSSNNRERGAASGVMKVLGAGLRRSPATALNGPLGRERYLATCSLPLDTLRRLRASTLASTNDLLLTLVGDALDRMFVSGDAGRSLRALYPVDRRGGNRRTAGNHLGGVLVNFGRGATLDERLTLVKQQTTAPLRATQSKGIKALGLGASLLPAAATPVIFALAGRYRVFNFVFSALRGSPAEQTLAGARVRHATAFGPLFPRVRCNITALRGDTEIRLGITSHGIDPSLITTLCATLPHTAERWARARSTP